MVLDWHFYGDYHIGRNASWASLDFYVPICRCVCGGSV